MEPLPQWQVSDIYLQGEEFPTPAPGCCLSDKRSCTWPLPICTASALLGRQFLLPPLPVVPLDRYGGQPSSAQRPPGASEYFFFRTLLLSILTLPESLAGAQFSHRLSLSCHDDPLFSDPVVGSTFLTQTSSSLFPGSPVNLLEI